MKNLFTLLATLAFSFVLTGQTETIHLDASVYFASASHVPAADELEKLNAFAEELTSYADYTLKIEAFTDEQGTDNYNAALASRRANTIAKALAARAVVATTTEVLSYGEKQARTNTVDDDERRTDRRVDLVATVVRWTDAAAAIKAVREGQWQTLTIDDPTVRQTISGRNGGVFMIEPNSLVRADGTPAEGAVSVGLVEAYDLSDMIIAGLTTTAAGKRLATGGMVNITATDAEGQALQLREGTSLTASIPTDDFNERMRIFSGTEHDEEGAPTDWAETEASVAPSADAFFALNNAPLDIAFFRVSVEKAVGKRLAIWRRANPEPKQPEILRGTGSTRVPEVVNVEEINYEPKGLKKLFMSKQKRAEKTAKKRKTAATTYTRRQVRYERNLDYAQKLPTLNQERQQKYKEDLAAWETALAAVKKSYTDEANLILNATLQKRREAYLAAREARLSALGDELAGMDDLSGRGRDVSRYFFGVSELGWTNVDIYTQDQDPIQVLAAVPNSTSEATVVMIPTDRRSVIAYNPDGAGNWKRSGIPRGVAYHVVAYQVLNGQLVMAHRFIDAAEEEKVETLDFQPVAVTELKEKLAGILGS